MRSFTYKKAAKPIRLWLTLQKNKGTLFQAPFGGKKSLSLGSSLPHYSSLCSYTADRIRVRNFDCLETDRHYRNEYGQ